MLSVVPKNYNPNMTIRETEIAIKEIKDYFERELARALNLTRVSAPLFVTPESGLNDELDGSCAPVSFGVPGVGGRSVEIVQSLAKWKRHALKRYGFSPGEGLYTDMNAIRRDEELDNLHSIYVDQWDWEKVIAQEERTAETLMEAAEGIFGVFKRCEGHMAGLYPFLAPVLPERLTYITSQALEDTYPELTPKERENAACRQYGAVFVSQIGGEMRSGTPHDNRAPDYDDWRLNGDLLFWYPMLGCAMEMSSMGVRVDAPALLRQSQACGCEERLEMPFHKGVMSGLLPFTIGGGLGQSRICMFMLRRAHIGEVQSSVWPPELTRLCESNNIHLL